MKTSHPRLAVGTAVLLLFLAVVPPLQALHTGRFASGYLGPSSCTRCHPGKVDEVIDSIHYTWRTPNPKLAYPGGGSHGMLDRFCALVGTSAMLNFYADLTGHQGSSACGKCHVGKFPPFPDPATGQPSQAQRDGIDCLICHAADGSYDSNGDGTYEAAESAAKKKLEIDPVTGARSWFQDRSVRSAESVGSKVSNAACLRCHEHGMGSPVYKRGTPFDPEHDVHAAAGLRCTTCHTVDHHKMARGSRVSDMHGWELQTVEVDCAQCHGAAPHPQDSAYNRHTSVVACETCHVPWTSGATRRVWASVLGTTSGPEASIPLYYPDRGVFEPYSDYSQPAYEVRPTHRWFNGNASMLAEPVHDPAAWDFKMATRETANAKIYPFRPIVSGMVVDRRGISVLPDFDSRFTMLAVMESMEQPLKMMGFMREEGLTAAERQVLGQFPNLPAFDKEHYVKTGNVKEAVDIGLGRMAVLMEGGNAFGTPPEQLMARGAVLWSGEPAGLDLPDNPMSPTYVADNDPTTATGSYISLSHAVKGGREALHCGDCHSTASVLDFKALNYSVSRIGELQHILDPVRISSCAMQGDQLMVRWPSVVGRTYRITGCTDLTTGTWTSVAEPIVAEKNPAEAVIATSVSQMKFFRVEFTP